MERLINVLDADVKRAVAAVGHSGLFYASALTLIRLGFLRVVFSGGGSI